MDSASGASNSNLVEVIDACGEWFVRIVEDGKDHSRSFEIESYALAFAEGQRICLGLEKSVRLEVGFIYRRVGQA